MIENIAICEMTDLEIKRDLCAISFELLDPTLNDSYRRWIYDRSNALTLELELRKELD